MELPGWRRKTFTKPFSLMGIGRKRQQRRSNLAGVLIGSFLR